MSAQRKDPASGRLALLDECHDLKTELAYITHTLQTIRHFATNITILGEAGHLALIAKIAADAPRLAKLGRSDAPDIPYDEEADNAREML